MLSPEARQTIERVLWRAGVTGDACARVAAELDAALHADGFGVVGAEQNDADRNEVGGWVWPGNVEPLLRWVSLFVGYSFDGSDWQAIEAALPSTDAEAADGWYDYPLMGTPPVQVHLAQNVGASPVMVRVVGDMDPVLAARIDTLLDVLADVGDRE